MPETGRHSNLVFFFFLRGLGAGVRIEVSNHKVSEIPHECIKTSVLHMHRRRCTNLCIFCENGASILDG